MLKFEGPYISENRALFKIGNYLYLRKKKKKRKTTKKAR